MKSSRFNRVIVSLIGVLLFSPFALAGQGPFGLGISIGSIIGPSFRYGLQKNRLLDGTIGWDHGDVELYLNHLWVRSNTLPISNSVAFDLYFGVGLAIDQVEKETQIGVRVPVGLRHLLRDPGIEFFGDIALNLFLAPETDSDISLQLGARYLF